MLDLPQSSSGRSVWQGRRYGGDGGEVGAAVDADNRLTGQGRTTWNEDAAAMEGTKEDSACGDRHGGGRPIYNEGPVIGDRCGQRGGKGGKQRASPSKSCSHSLCTICSGTFSF